MAKIDWRTHAATSTVADSRKVLAEKACTRK